MARPQIEIEYEKLAALMRYKPTASDCAAFFQCSVDTIERRIKEFTADEENPDGISFADFREQNMVHTRFSLIQKAIRKAEHGDNTMLIFTLKNLCGWSDRNAGDQVVIVNQLANKSDDELDAVIARLSAPNEWEQKKVESNE